MTILAHTALRGNSSNHATEPARIHREAVPNLYELTAGGREIYRRTRRPAATCNLIAEIAGLGGRLA